MGEPATSAVWNEGLVASVGRDRAERSAARGFAFDVWVMESVEVDIASQGGQSVAVRAAAEKDVAGDVLAESRRRGDGFRSALSVTTWS